MFRGDMRPALGVAATVTFSPTTVALLSTYGTGRGVAGISLDGTHQGEVMLYRPQQQLRQVIFQATGLAEGTHELVMTATGDAPSGSTSARVDFDAAVVIRPVE
jgi:hypothetical protein